MGEREKGWEGGRATEQTKGSKIDPDRALPIAALLASYHLILENY